MQLQFLALQRLLEHQHPTLEFPTQENVESFFFSDLTCYSSKPDMLSLVEPFFTSIFKNP